MSALKPKPRDELADRTTKEMARPDLRLVLGDVNTFPPSVVEPGTRLADNPAGDRGRGPRTWWEWFERSAHERAKRLAPLWEMTPAQRVAAMRRGVLTYEQLTAWSAKHPDEVPRVDGEWEWIVAKMPEFCE